MSTKGAVLPGTGRRGWRTTLALALMVGGSAPLLAEQPQDREIQLQPQPLQTLRDVKIAIFDTATGKYRAKSTALTDVWLRLSVERGTIEQRLTRANAARIDKGEALFTIELLAVVDGRLHSDTKGHCSGWMNDVAWCTYGCDGQGFQLQRLSTQYPVRMSILLADKMPAAGETAAIPARRPMALTLCGADERGLELLVVPSKGAAGEIKFGNK